MFLALVQQDVHADYVRMHEGIGGEDAAVDVRLGGEIDDSVDVVLLENAADGATVGDVGALEAIVLLVVDGQQIVTVAGVSQLIQHDDVVVGIGLDHIAREGAADEPRCAGD